MKKFTLLIALLFCFVSFSQKGQVDSRRLEAPKKIETTTKKQNARKSDQRFANFNDIPAGVDLTVSARSASFKAKKVVASVEHRGSTTSQNARVSALLERYFSLGSQPGLVSDFFTDDEITILRHHFAATNQSYQKTAVVTTSDSSVDLKEGVSRTTGSQTQTFNATHFNGYSFQNSGNSRMPDLAYTSGPYFAIAGPPDVSMLEDTTLGMGTYGFGVQVSAGNRIADDIILADDYDITSLVFYGYQSFTPTAPPTINEINVQIWDGDPAVGGSTVIWGDDVTNVVSSVVWSDAYRQLESAPGGTDRAIHRITVDVAGLSLAAGTYWVDWQIGGTAASGPWQPPVNILGVSATGNAQQSIAGVWGPMTDVDQQGAPIEVYGDCTSCGGGGTPVAYGVNNATANFVSWDPAAPEVLNPVGGVSPAPTFEGGGAVDPNNPGTAYGMDVGGTLYSIDVATGTYTALGAVNQPGAETVSGMEFDPVSGTLYMLTTDITTSTLSTVDIGTLTSTPIAATGMAGGIGLAIDGAGNGWAYDILDDSFYSVDLGSGAATLVGPIGFDANFGQGMCWDVNTDTIYMSAFNNGAFAGEWRTVDTATGATTLVGGLGSTTPGGTVQVAWSSVPDAGGGGGGGGPCNQDHPLSVATGGTGSSVDSDFKSASDIVVSAGEDFTIDTIDAVFLTFAPNDPPTTANIVYYEDNAGFPGAMIGSETVVPTIVSSAPWVNPIADQYITTMSVTPFTFAGDPAVDTTYWIEVSMGTATNQATVFWEYTDDVPVEGNPYAQYDGTVGTWSYPDPIREVVYDYQGTCDPIGAGNDCNQEHTLSGVAGGGLGSSVDSDFKTAADITVAIGEDFTIDTIDAVFLTFAPNDPPTTANIAYYEDNAGLPGTMIGSETVVPTIVSSAPWANPIADQYVTTMSVTPFTFTGDLATETKYWIEVSMGTATNQATVFWEYTNDTPVEGEPAAQFDGTAGTWSIPDPTQEVVYNFSGTCDPTVVVTYDTCDGARDLNCGDTVMGDTLTATVDAVDDCDPGTPDAPGVWYKWEDTTGLAANVAISTCSTNTDYDTQITVFTGDCNGVLTCLATNDDDPACTDFQSTVEFESDGSSTYYIMVHGYNGAVGNFELSMSCTLIPPDNDMIVNAIDLDEVGCPFTDENVAMPAATTENGNPTDCDITGANGVWYKFTPEGDGFITGTVATPAGTTAVNFFTAPDETSTEDELTLVPYFDNQCLPSDSTTIPVVANQAYYCFVLNTGGITDIVFDNCQLDVASNQLEGFAFYPNPANDRLNLSSIDNIEKVALYNILGQKVIDLDVNATTTQVDVSRLSVGAYIMKVSSNGQTGTYKVIKK